MAYRRHQHGIGVAKMAACKRQHGWHGVKAAYGAGVIKQQRNIGKAAWHRWHA